jgi:hypothetical protein
VGHGTRAGSNPVRRAAAAASLALSVAATLVGLGVGVAPATAAPAAADTPARPAAATQTVAVDPLTTTGTLRPAYRVSHRHDETSCISGSTQTGDDYRCSTPRSRQTVYDPCWLTADGTDVDCLDAPWQHEVTRLTVTGGFDDSAPMRPTKRPWGLEVRVEGTTRCLVDVGSVSGVDGHPITYGCNHRVTLTGGIDRSRAVWRIRAYRAVRGAERPLGTVRVAKAYSGAPSLRASSG